MPTVAGRLAPTSLTMSVGEKLLVTGQNGAGKSTLLHLIAGELAPTVGHVEVRASARVGLLTQEVVLPDPTSEVLIVPRTRPTSI